MKYPTISAGKNGSAQTLQFGGLNRRETGNEGEFSDMNNIAGGQNPCITVRKGRAEAFSVKDTSGKEVNIQAMIAPKYENGPLTAFTGVAGGAFYYNGEKTPFEDAGKTLPEDEKMKISGNDICLADFNGVIIICPQMYYFSYVPEPDTAVRKMEKGFYGAAVKAYSSGNPEEDAEVINYLEKANGWGDTFKSGDCIFLKGFEGDLAVNNTVSIDSKFEEADDSRPLSVVVQKIEGNKLYFQMTNRRGKLMVLKNGTKNASGQAATLDVYIPIPDMNWVCVHNNRLWGTNPNGEQIYASKLGDAFNFNTFAGLGTDSWYSEIGTKGGFVGIVSFRDSVVAFKRDFIHHVYGDKPSSFSIPTQIEDCGCIDIKSAAVAGGNLYFLGYRGFYAYTGGNATLISDKLNMTYTGAAAMTDGRNYYVHAQRSDGKTEFLKFDAELGAWYKEDDINLAGYVRWNNNLYAAEGGHVWRLDGDNSGVKWFFDTTVITEDTMQTKGVFDLFLRVDNKGGKDISVYILRDNGETRLCGTIKDDAFRTHRVPVRFQMGDSCKIRVEGTGDCVIHGIERTVYAGGKRYR